jgi:glucosylceramidase
LLKNSELPIFGFSNSKNHMKHFLFALFVFAFGFTACNKIGKSGEGAQNYQAIHWISSSPDSLWQIKTVTMTGSDGYQASSIRVFPDSTLQKIDGFGGCFNELGWEALNGLSSAEREKIISSLFDTVSGCKFNLCRMPIGANDYAIDWYSHSSVKDDFSMKNFSIERDKKRLIPYINTAKSYNPDLKIWASPWCPPEWMKTNMHYACRPDKVNDLKESGKGEEMKNQFRMEEKYLSAYALYFSKFIQSYKNEGIDIYAVHVQNEPNSCQNFPSCVWKPSGLATFIGGYLGPQFAKDTLNTEIWLGTIERPQIERVDTILTDQEAKKYIKGIGFQWAGKDAIPLVHAKYPDYKLMQTETECGDGSNDWKAAEHTFELMKHYFKNGANAYMYWNMVLNETGKSQWGWKQNSMITIDSKTSEVNYNPEFYLMKHLSSFVKPGALVIKTSDENCIAFKNEDSIIMLYFNSGEKSEKEFVILDIKFKAALSGKSFNTFKIKINK